MAATHECSSLVGAQTSFACLQDFEHTSSDVIFSRVLSETYSASAQSHVSMHPHCAQCGADLASVAGRPDRKGHFIFEGVLYFMADYTRKCDADDLEDVRW